METVKPNSETDFDGACQFLIDVGKAAHSYGSTSARLERCLIHIAKELGIEGQFKISPTEIVFAFRSEAQAQQRVELASLNFGGLDLDKLACLGELIDNVLAGLLSYEQASKQLAVIAARQAPWGTFASVLSYVGVGAGISVLFAGSWWDVAIASLLGVVVFLMVYLVNRFGESYALWLPFTTAFVSAILTGLFKLVIPELNFLLIVLAAVVILIPGYGISLGVAELVAQKTVSGLANFMNGLVYLVKQILGAWLGLLTITPLLPQEHQPLGVAADPMWLWLFMPILIIGLCAAFQTSKRDLIWACLGCSLAYAGIVIGTALVDMNFGNLLGTVLAVVFANRWSNKTARPNSIVLIPAVVLLVSGSIGFRGLAAMTQGQFSLGEQQFAQMLIVALTIVAGLIIGNTILKAKTSL